MTNSNFFVDADRSDNKAVFASLVGLRNYDRVLLEGRTNLGEQKEELVFVRIVAVPNGERFVEIVVDPEGL